MIKLFFSALLALACAGNLALTLIWAERLHTPSPPIQWSGLKNAGRLYLTYCWIGDHLCIEREAIAYGQVCSPSMAGAIGSGSEGEVRGFSLPGMRYVSWRCETFNPDDKPPYGKQGLAGQKYEEAPSQECGTRCEIDGWEDTPEQRRLMDECSRRPMKCMKGNP